MNTIPSKIWNVIWTATGLLAIFLLVISIKEIKSIAYVGKSEQIVNTISVNGKGEAVSVPDIATFSFSVDETASAVADAQTKATTKINAAIKAVKDSGIADKDIKTTGYNINPHYDYQDGVCTTGGICRPSKQVLTGYEVSQTVEVKARDITKAGALFQTVGALNVQNVNNLIFSVDDIDSVKAAARKEAIANAQSKAKELAAQLGVTIVRVNSFEDQSASPMPMYDMAANQSAGFKTMAALAAPPSIPAGEQKVTSNVTITYEIR